MSSYITVQISPDLNASTVELCPSGNTYPDGKITLTEVGGNDKVEFWGATITDIDNYDVYIDGTQQGQTELNNRWIGTDQIKSHINEPDVSQAHGPILGNQVTWGTNDEENQIHATLMPIADPNSNFTATDVMGALDELSDQYTSVVNPSNTAKRPLNLSIASTDIPDFSTYVPSSIDLSNDVLQQAGNPRIRVRLQWNHQATMETSDGQTWIAAAGDPLALSTGEVNEYYAWIPDQQKDYKITASNGDQITIDTDGDDLSGLSGQQIDITMHPECDFYVITAKRRIADGSSVQDQHQQTWMVAGNNSGLAPDDVYIHLEAGLYDLSVYAYNNTVLSGKTTLTSQTIDLSDIAADGTVNATPTSYGFEVTIGNWADATAFEVLIATNALDWASRDQTRIISRQRTFNFPVGAAGRYNIGVRPLQHGIVVGDPVTTTVSTTGGGARSAEKVKSVQVDLTAAKTTEAERKIRVFSETGPIDITRLVFDPDAESTSTDASKLRIYPVGNQNDARYMDVADDNTQRPQKFDIDDPLQIVESGGKYEWVLSAFDDNAGAGGNAKELHGSIDIHYLPAIRTRNTIITDDPSTGGGATQ